MLDIGKKVFPFCTIIGPHGANMANVLYVRPGCTVVEVGFLDPGFTLPADYYCFSRNLGQDYWMVAAEGNYGSPLVPNLDELLEIVTSTRAKAQSVP